MNYGKRANGKAHGVVNTKVSVVKKMLDLVGYKGNKDLSKIKILEPSAGNGAFAIEIITRLYESSNKHNFNFNLALSNIYLCELNEQIANELQDNIKSLLCSYGDFKLKNIFIQDFLQLELIKKFDIVIGNPPYVRHENISQKLKMIYQRIYSTFTHRSDLYIPFFEKSLRLLNKNGKLIYVCSNRWLKNQYGENLRNLISNQYNLESIIDLEKAEIFQEDVLGYPAITIISNEKGNLNSKYSEISDLNSFIKFEQTKSNSIRINLSNSDWFNFPYVGKAYEKYLSKIEEQELKIGIGVATGRDSIFISKSFEGIIEEELLLPILTSKDVKSDEIKWCGNYIINPYDKYGNLINLNDFPLAKKYFNSNKAELSKRHVAKKDQSKFYKTIDKIYPDLLTKPKVILPDISGNRFINVDKGSFYPHHNLYYVTCKSYRDACILASTLMSDFVYKQLIHIGNKMKGGYPRWQSQNLRKLRIPILKSMPDDIEETLLDAYENKDLLRINKLITPDNIERFKIKEGQGVLFESEVQYSKKSGLHNKA